MDRSPNSTPKSTQPNGLRNLIPDSLSSTSILLKSNIWLTTELFSAPLPGGIKRFARYAPGLRERGLQMNMLTLNPEEGEQPAEAQAPDLGVTRLICPFPRSEGVPEAERRWLLNRTIELCQRTPGPHVIQPNALSFKMMPLLLRAKRNGIPVIYNVTIMPETPPSVGAIQVCKQWLDMKLTFGLVTRFVCLSQEMVRTYKTRSFLRDSQLMVIPNGVDEQRFRPANDPGAKRQIRSSLGLPPNDPVVLFVGGLMPRKGVDILLESWPSLLDRHPTAKLVLLGSKSGRLSHRSAGLSSQLEQYLEDIDRRIAELPKSDSVVLPGDVEDPVPWYQAADVFTFPSHREGLPNAVLEAMACGLPCLVSPFDGLPRPGEELGWPGRHYEIASREPEIWAGMISSLLRTDQDGRRRAMGEHARSWIVTHHRLDATLDRWSNLYLGQL